MSRLENSSLKLLNDLGMYQVSNGNDKGICCVENVSAIIPTSISKPDAPDKSSVNTSNTMAADAKTERRSRKQSKPRGWPRRVVQAEELPHHETLNGEADDDDEFEGNVNLYKEQEVMLRQRSKPGSVRKSSRTRKSLSYTDFGDNDPIDSEDDVITRSYKNDSNSLFTNNDSEKYSESSKQTNSLMKPKASRNLKPNAQKTLLGVGRQDQVLGKTDNQKRTRSGSSVRGPVDSLSNSDNATCTTDNLDVDKDPDNSKEADTAATPKRSRSRFKAKKAGGQAHAVLRNRDLAQLDHSLQSEADLDQNLEEAEEPVTNRKTKGKSKPKTSKSSATSIRVSFKIFFFLIVTIK